MLKRIGMMLLFISAVGCRGVHEKMTAHINNTLDSYNESLAAGNKLQASERLRRCANSGPDKEKCAVIQESLRKKAIEDKQREKIELEIKRIETLRVSTNPWDNISLAMEIQAGHIDKAYANEDTVLIKKSFYGFGVCAKNNDPSCMSQYAQMILLGMDSLPKENLSSTKAKALYWLNLSARYGNENARRSLLELEEPIPTPDLSMEILQKDANSLAKETILASRESERRQSYYNSQMLEEKKRQNLIASFNNFFPKIVSCTSNKVGSYVFTNCN